MLLPALLLAGLAGPSSAARSVPLQAEGPAQDQSPIWARDFEDAKVKAELQNRLILLVFVGARCKACPGLEQDVLKDKRVVEWMERHVIALRVFDDAALAATYSVETVPVVMLLDRSLKEVDRVTDHFQAAALVTALVDVYEGRGGVARAEREVDANPDDPDAHLALARALRNRGRSNAALEHYLWAFDHLRGDPAREDERLGTLLGDIKVLQRGLAEASRELLARRDAAASKLIDAYDPETPLAELLLCARELEALDAATSNVAFTEYAWETLRKREGYPREVVDTLFVTTVQAKLIQDKRYQDYLDAIGDPLVRLDQDLAELHALRARLVEQRRGELEIQNAGNGIAHRATWYYEALHGVGRKDEADAVIEMLLTLEPSAQAYVLMVGALHGSGRLAEATALRDQGMAKLPEGGEKKRFERVTKQVLSRAGR